MARQEPRKDVVIVGLGWTGSILGMELSQEGLDIVALERGAAAARPAAAGSSQAVVAFVPVREAEEFAETFAKDFEITEVGQGEPARLED